MATIKAIEGRTVHQIQSGQVIVDLCSVVKELVENSLDAGATSIDVRFKNQGLDAIEVQDNGDGITPANYDTLALKHHTSKLSTYSDLTTLQTFGFRGEALSSLCALSKFTVVTCMAQDTPKGTKLEFEVSGKLKGTSVVAAQKGTVVSVENLFNNLPVRRRELERNIKREWNRVTGVLGQYACIQTNIKFSVSQQAGKGKKTTLFSTKGNQSTKENIVNVFGAKTLTALVPLDLNLELEATSGPSQRWSTQEDGGKKDIRIVGHISRPASGEGRQTPDRQMFFVNSRPCGLPQVAKAFNEVYKTYNASQSPFIFANIELDTHLYDVNVSPDKRTILLHDQNRMLETLKICLTELFESQDYTVPISQLPTQKQPSYKQLTISRENTTTSSASRESPAPRAPSESTEGGESDERPDSRAARSEQSNEHEELFVRKSDTKLGGASVSRDLMDKANEGVSLISNWVGRKSDDREEAASAKILVAAPAGLSEEKRRLVEKLRKEGEARAQLLEEASSGTESSISTTQSTEVEDFHRRPLPPVPAFQERLYGNNDSPLPEADDETSPVQPEMPIPILASPATSPAKPQSSIADRFSRTASSQRAPAEIATITIGDQTITSSIGTPCPKRSRMDPPSTWRGNASTQNGAKSGPTFGSSLSQRFAAPGTARQSSVSEERTEGDDEDTQDAFPTPQLMESSHDDSMDAVEPVDLMGLNQQSSDVADSPESMEVEIKEETSFDHSGITAEVDQPNVEITEAEKKALEDSKVQQMIQQAEKAANISSQDNVQRTKSLLKGGSKKKDATTSLVQTMSVSASQIRGQLQALENMLAAFEQRTTTNVDNEGIDATEAEEKLSLIISKADFAKMKVIGQFNLGFILATRTPERNSGEIDLNADDLFIIDQHASDEKYNFERLQATTIVQSQRLVQPKTLDLTAMEEEIVMENLPALSQNGFVVKVDQSGDSPVGQRCQLVSLPLSGQKAFTIQDLEELIALLADNPPGTTPRPSGIRKMFAMRACRSSIMIGKTLTHKKMEIVVKHLGELDKPWNCPHGRPTMRHLCGLGAWDETTWKEGNDNDPGNEIEESTGSTDWAAYIKNSQATQMNEAVEDESIEDDIEDDD